LAPAPAQAQAPASPLEPHPVLEQLRVKNDYNPSNLDLSLTDKAR
jgi:hypothetical protein